MIYGIPPFAQLSGGPLAKMNAIADSSHRISYPETAVSKQIQTLQDTCPAVKIDPSAIDTMRHCLAYRKEQRLTIPELLQHEFLRPQAKGKTVFLVLLMGYWWYTASAMAPDSTSITIKQMAMLVNFVLRDNNLEPLAPTATLAEVSLALKPILNFSSRSDIGIIFWSTSPKCFIMRQRIHTH